MAVSKFSCTSLGLGVSTYYLTLVDDTWLTFLMNLGTIIECSTGST
jgi:hypothetical protein